MNKNKDGLIRQYFSKQRDLTTVAKEEVEQTMGNSITVQEEHLRFQTPFEVFFNTKTSLTDARKS